MSAILHKIIDELDRALHDADDTWNDDFEKGVVYGIANAIDIVWDVVMNHSDDDDADKGKGNE